MPPHGVLLTVGVEAYAAERQAALEREKAEEAAEVLRRGSRWGRGTHAFIHSAMLSPCTQRNPRDAVPCTHHRPRSLPKRPCQLVAPTVVVAAPSSAQAAVTAVIPLWVALAAFGNRGAHMKTNAARNDIRPSSLRQPLCY